MRRSFATLTLAVLITYPVPAQQTAAKLSIRWHGQSFFEIESSKGTRIAIDPHYIDGYGRKEVAADILLISHEHNDHNQLAAIRNPMKAEVLRGLKQKGNKLDWNPIDKKVRDIRIRTVGVYHDNVQGLEKGKNAVFILEIDGLKVVHLGDLGHVLTATQVKEIGPVDVLMVPVGGVYGINGSEAKKVVEQLKPRLYIIPMHYGTKVFDDVLPPDEFLDEQTNVRRLPNNRLEVDTGAKPDAPVIVMMDWKN